MILFYNKLMMIAFCLSQAGKVKGKCRWWCFYRPRCCEVGYLIKCSVDRVNLKDLYWIGSLHGCLHVHISIRELTFLKSNLNSRLGYWLHIWAALWQIVLYSPDVCSWYCLPSPVLSCHKLHPGLIAASILGQQNLHNFHWLRKFLSFRNKYSSIELATCYIR